MKAEVRLALNVLMNLCLLKSVTTQNTCPPGTFGCHTTPNTCIPVASRCNFLVDCQDSSDEDDCACTDQRYTCNFSDETVCGFKQDLKHSTNFPNFKKWSVMKETALPPDLNDQSGSGTRGHVMMLLGADMPRDKNVFMTQTITGYHEPRTLRLLYNSNSNSIFEIRYRVTQVLFHSEFLKNKSKIWTPINALIPAEVFSRSKFELTYHAIGRGELHLNTCIAIDDVEITHSRCLIDTTTTTTATSTTTTTPAECQDGTFGLTCTKTCRCSDQTEICHKITGGCNSGCLSGWKGSDCQQRDCAHKAYCGIHTCEELDQNYSCSCLDGYKNSDSQHCEDKDECKQENICDIHTCMNLNGSFDCICNNRSYENIHPQICVIRISGMNDLDSLFLIDDINVIAIYTVLSVTIIVYIYTVIFLCSRTVARALRRWCTTIPYTRRMYACPFNSPESIGELFESEDNSVDTTIDDLPTFSNEMSRLSSYDSYFTCIEYETRPNTRKASIVRSETNSFGKTNMD